MVDDEPGNLSTFVRCFRRDYELKTALSAAEAVAALEAGPIDVVVTDQAMPQVTGVELLKVVSARWPHVARLVVSGHENQPELIKARRDGLAHELLWKPWEKADVLAAIARAMNVVRPRQGP